MTDGHKHHVVPIRTRTRLGKAVLRLLRKPRWHTTNLRRVDASPYPYGPCDLHRGCWYISVMSVLHRWTGLTLEWHDD